VEFLRTVGLDDEYLDDVAGGFFVFLTLRYVVTQRVAVLLMDIEQVSEPCTPAFFPIKLHPRQDTQELVGDDFCLWERRGSFEF